MTKNPQNLGHQIIQWAFYLLFAGITFVYSSSVFAYTLLPKRFVLYACLTIAAVGWILKTDWGKHLKLNMSPGLLPLILLCLWAIGLISLATHPLDTLVEITFHASFLVIFIITANNFSEIELSKALKVITLIGGIVGLLGVLQYFNLMPISVPSNGPPSATFGYRNFAAMFLIATLPLVLLHILTTPQKAHQVLGGVAALFMTLFLIYTRTRGAWLGLGIGLFFALIIGLLHPTARAVYRAHLTRTHLILGIASIILIALLGAQTPRFTDTGLQRFDEKKATVTTTVTSILQSKGDRGRIEMWQNTLAMTADQPLLGVGLGGWKRIYPQYDNGVMIRRNSSPVRPHNDYLWLTSELGLIGFALCLWFGITVLLGLYKILNQAPSYLQLTALLSSISLVAIATHALFSFPKEQPQTMAIAFWICGIIAFASPKTAKRLIPSWAAKAILSTLVLFGIGATTLTYYQMRADHHYLEAIIAEKNNNWAQVDNQIGKSLNNGTFRTHAWVIQGRAKERQGQYQDAEAAYKQALFYAPHSWHAHNGLGIVYKRQNDLTKALAHNQKALTYFPGTANYDAIPIRTNLGALYKSMGKKDLAEREYRTILKIDPRAPGANNNMGNIYLARGQIDSAKTAYHAALQSDSTLVQAHTNLAALYLKSKQLQKAKYHAQTAVIYRPEHARVYWTLARILEANSEILPAIDAYNLAIQANPKFSQAYFDKANILYGIKKYLEAQQAYQLFTQTWTGEASYIQFATDRIKLCQEYHRRQTEFQKKR